MQQSYKLIFTVFHFKRDAPKYICNPFQIKNINTIRFCYYSF